MIFKQLFDTKSSTYTYLIASDKGREALIIDPVIENTDIYTKELFAPQSDVEVAEAGCQRSLDALTRPTHM